MDETRSRKAQRRDGDSRKAQIDKLGSHSRKAQLEEKQISDEISAKIAGQARTLRKESSGEPTVRNITGDGR